MLGLVRNNEKRFKIDVAIATEMVKEGKENKIMDNYVWDEFPLSASTYLNLFADSANTAIFNFFNLKDKLPTLGKIKQPVIAIMGKKDDALTVSVEETMERIKKALTLSKKVETVILGDADHGYNEYEQQLADTLKTWILKN